jgi:hypothetical protein
MLVHHSLNYFPVSLPAIKYVRFVSAAFIFITGYLIGCHYSQAYALGRSVGAQRLFRRGLKLLALFLGLNFCSTYVKSHVSPLALHEGRYGAQALNLLLTGDYTSVDFELLVPIAYTLLFFAALLRANCINNSTTLALSVTTLLVAMSWPEPIPGSYYFRHFVFGVAGVYAGRYSNQLERYLTRRPLVFITAFFIQLFAILMVPMQYVVYVLVVTVSLAFYYVMAARITTHLPHLAAQLSLLGRYSLFSYIFQILILNLCTPARKLLIPDYLRTVSVLMAVTSFTFVCVLAVEKIRRRSRLLDLAYRAIFA